MSKAENVSIPTIHMNGSSAQSLKNDLEGAYRALGLALEAMHETAPHARDYYVQKQDGAFAVAQTQYFDRLRSIERIRLEVLSIFEGIEQQEREREKHKQAPVERWPQFGGHIDTSLIDSVPGSDDPMHRALDKIHEAHEQRVKTNTEKAQQHRLDVLMIEIRESDETEIGKRAARVCREIGLEFSIREFEDFQSDLRAGHRIFTQ